MQWSETQNIVWKVPLSGGWSSPVIAGGRVWVTAVDATRNKRGEDSVVSLRLIGLDVATGREVVNTEVFKVDSPGAINLKNSRASPTPIIDGDRIYVHFGADGTAALTATRSRQDDPHTVGKTAQSSFGLLPTAYCLLLTKRG